MRVAIILVTVIVVPLVIAVAWRLDADYENGIARERMSRQMEIDAVFTRGFSAGSSAVIKWMKQDTETGKWALDVTNLFNELVEAQKKESAFR